MKDYATKIAEAWYEGESSDEHDERVVWLAEKIRNGTNTELATLRAERDAAVSALHQIANYDRSAQSFVESYYAVRDIAERALGMK